MLNFQTLKRGIAQTIISSINKKREALFLAEIVMKAAAKVKN